MRLMETESPLTTDMKGPGLVRFQLRRAFPLRKKFRWTGVDGESMMDRAVRAPAFLNAGEATKKLVVMRVIIRMRTRGFSVRFAISTLPSIVIGCTIYHYRGYRLARRNLGSQRTFRKSSNGPS